MRLVLVSVRGNLVEAVLPRTLEEAEVACRTSLLRPPRLQPLTAAAGDVVAAVLPRPAERNAGQEGSPALSC
jgi:hypothetical protein